jgi:2-methylcitrate dehydratase PrpD
MASSSAIVHSGVTGRLARFAAEIEYSHLPPVVTQTMKHLLLDSIGTALAAGTLGEGCSELVALVRNQGGVPESTIIGFGDRVPAVMASLVNGGLVHSLNYDAVGAAHLGLVIPAAVAAAERNRSSGRDLITALAVACEVAARMALAVRRPNEAVLAGQVLGYVAASAGAGRIMRLSAAQMHSAFGIAVMQAAGARQVSVVGGEPPAKAIYGAFPNHGGMLAVELAASGLGAECDALEGQAGFYAMFYGGEFDTEALLGDLGQQYACLGATFKPWPTSGVVTPFVEAALDVVRQHRPRATDVDHIHMRGGPRARGWLEPPEERKHPRNAAAAANSVYFAVAKVFTNGRLTLADFGDAALTQPESQMIAERMDHQIEENLGQAAIVEMRTADIQVSKRVDSPLGSPEHPMSDDQLLQKFLDCASHAVNRTPHNRLREVVERIGALEEESDVRRLLSLL